MAARVKTEVKIFVTENEVEQKPILERIFFIEDVDHESSGRTLKKGDQAIRILAANLVFIQAVHPVRIRLVGKTDIVTKMLLVSFESAQAIDIHYVDPGSEEENEIRIVTAR